MPFYLKESDILPRVAGLQSVLIVPCRFCDAAVETVRDSIRSTDCRVIQGMENEGIMNVLPTVSFPFNISLEVQGITYLIKKESKE